MKSFQIIAQSPAGAPDPSIAIAASRAGGVGVLDLEYTRQRDTAIKSFSKLACFAQNDFGIKLNCEDIKLLNKLKPKKPDHFKIVILTHSEINKLKPILQKLHSKELSVLFECTSMEQAMAAEQAGVDGIIAKGHEAGGRVADETTFILVQQFVRQLSLPIWAQGGIGLHTAAACYAAGAAGVVLDAQLLLTRESNLPQTIKAQIAKMDGSETQCLGGEINVPYRVCSRPGTQIVKKLRDNEKALLKKSHTAQEKSALWRKEICRYLEGDDPQRRLFLFGQDIALAAPLADRFVTVGGIIQAIQSAIDQHCSAARKTIILAEDSALAKSHRTAYPIVQGPMARVSDNAAFITATAQHGALPFVAAAWMRHDELDALLGEIKTTLNGSPWGVGLLGFLPQAIYDEQIKTMLLHRPPFALIAGGQPGQAEALEREGIATYVHVPSPGLLRMFLERGIQRFVFEGRESGGHVGPLCGFVMWEKMIEILLASLNAGKNPEKYHVLFAGGIHDALSAAMAALMASTLVERGVRVGFQMGSAYLFTDEAVDTGAVVRKYINEAVQCEYTALLETSAGHTVRCIDNPFAKFFKSEKLRLTQTDLAADKIQSALEHIKLGRLRIATKGLSKNSDYDGSPSTPKLVPVSEDEQSSQGLYMIGQLAALRQKTCSMAQLHQSIIDDGSKRIEALIQHHPGSQTGVKEPEKPSDIAIIGMACLLPNAPNLQQYWENILNKITAIKEVPSDRWDWRRYYSEDRTDADKVYSKWGAFIDPMAFDPIQYGMPPNTLSSIEPLQLLTLEVASEALKDAGYRQRPFPKERTAVIPLGFAPICGWISRKHYSVFQR
jgi:NAD(P)H-dependent flavin oxidoreductase YrpB (nitropropane dioxygenase family)